MLATGLLLNTCLQEVLFPQQAYFPIYKMRVTVFILHASRIMKRPSSNINCKVRRNLDRAVHTSSASGEVCRKPLPSLTAG